MARMSEVKITPLAKRLAEENGIDWRQLSGTGPDNTVVERDILAFLAKVMAGEVNLPPTPEDAAPPPEAIPDIAQAQAMLQREGVELGDLVPTAVAPPMVEPAPVPADDFDFDIDLDLDEPILAAEPEPLPVPPPIPTPPAPEPLRAVEPPPLTWEPAEAFKPTGGLTPPPHPELADLPPLPTETDLEPLNPSLSLEPEPLPEPSPTPPIESPKLVWETQEVLPPPPAPEPSPLQAGMSFSSGPAEPPSPEPEPEPIAEPELELPPVIAEPTEPVAPPVAPPMAQPEPEAAPEPIPAPQPAPEVAPEPAPAPTPQPAPVPPVPPMPAMLRVQVWQRLVDVKPVQEAAQVLAEAWQREIGLYPLLFRAVDKALSDTHSQLRATKGVLSGEELSSYRVTPSQSLRGTLDSLEMAADAFQGLTVLSLLDSAFDQVIFPGTSTLTLGRANGNQALLAVSGELNAEQAGALLERIAYYLERPILLA